MKFTSAEFLAAGIVILILNLTSRHIEALHNDAMILVTGWAGSILIVVGLGVMFFLEDRL